VLIGIGDADGLGETRKKELIKSGMSLGLRKEDDVFIVESAYVSILSHTLRLITDTF
jgi:N-acetylglucosaminylphosphatidylinositol deacetylase